MVHEAWGIDDVLRRHADRLASAGYLVHAPDLLGEGLWLRCIRSTLKALQARSGKPFELIESCRRELRADPDCTGRVGIIGFCMGGGFALLLSAEGYDGASVNYGRVPADIDELAARARPSWPATAARTGRPRACLRCERLCAPTTYDMMSRSIRRPATAFSMTSRTARCCSEQWRSWPMRGLSRCQRPTPGGELRPSLPSN
jgi:Dienelactone hydrolase family